MEKTPNGYHISFFKPTTEHAHANRNMVIWLVLIWFVAIFGFHILLKVLEKPTPEPAYTAFTGVWDQVKTGEAASEEMITLGQSALSVLGKVAITTKERAVLDNALSWSLYQLTPDSLRSELVKSITSFEKIENEIITLSDQEYNNQKTALKEKYAPVLELSAFDARSAFLPLELASANIDNLSEETLADMPVIMEKYLVHNQSVLTDTKFLGFPFHYFYTAIFLLVLFVGICWLYCIYSDRLNTRLNVAD